MKRWSDVHRLLIGAIIILVVLALRLSLPYVPVFGEGAGIMDTMSPAESELVAAGALPGNH
jgi:hypothetical protein